MFKRARSLRQILAYICEQYFAGGTPNIKEYNIAVEALGRGIDFDSNADTIVRVEASRLRRRLREYYATEGADHPIQLLLSNTGYVPQFVVRQPESELPAGTDAKPDILPPPGPVPSFAEAHKTQAPPRRVSRKWIGFIAGGAAALLVAVLVVVQFYRPRNAEPAGARTASAPPPATVRPAVETLPGEETRILCGYTRPQFVDSLGRVWYADRYYQGGAAQEHADDVVGVTDPTMYHTSRLGREFRYDIPLKPGVYELHLLFVEAYFGKLQTVNSGEGSRVFSVAINGVTRFPTVDIFADAGGPDIPADRVLKDVSPASDGFLHLAFSGINDWASVSGIEIVPAKPGKMRPVRIVAGGRSYYDRAGRFWGADRYFIGGRSVRRIVSLRGTDDPELYSNSRWGRFTYSIPVPPDGTYKVTLKFAETFYGGGPSKAGAGSRIFDVYCNGLALLRGFDIIKEAGGENRVIDRVFHQVKATAQGKIVLSFAPVIDYATVCAIEVVDEDQ